MYQYDISQVSNHQFDLIIRLEANDVEFALDFFSRKHSDDEYKGFIDFLKEKNKQVKIRSVKIFVSGFLIATIPFSIFTQAAAQSHSSLAELASHSVASAYGTNQTTKFNMTYLYGGTVDQQIQQVQQVGSFQTVSPSYFDINSNGKLVVNSISQKLIDTMHQMGIKVVPMLSNHWDRTAGKLALQDPEGLAKQLASYINQYGLDGINVDIENVTTSERDAYTRLVKSLREMLPAHKEVSVAVAANPNGWGTGWHGSYDYAALGKYADYLMIMAYDESWEGSAPGPVASTNFARRSVEYALKHVPADKIVLGVPFYGRIWSADGAFNGNGVSLKTLQNMLKDYNATITYSETHQSPKAEFTVKAGDKTYTVNGKTLKPGNYTVWFENERSLESKTQLIHQYDLKGLGSWALSQAPDSILSNITSWITSQEGDPDVRYGTVTATSLRVRKSASTQSETIAYYAQGDRVTIVGETAGWYRVKLENGSYGYVSADYIDLETPETVQREAYSTGNNVRVRAQPSTSGVILSTVSFGDAFTVLGDEQNGWYQVRLKDNTEGYIYGDYVSFQKPISEKTGYSTGNNVRVRQAPSTSSNILTEVFRGDSFTVLGEIQNGWYQVRLSDGSQGYIHGDYVSFQKPVTTRTGYSTADQVRVRTGASTQSSILTTVSRGTSFTVLGEAQNGWYRVRLSDTLEGYIYSDYVSFTKPPLSRTGYSSGSNVRIRKSPTTSSAILGTLSVGQSFEVIGEKSGSWYAVRLSNGTQGYVHSDYVSFTKPSASRTGYSAGSNVRVRKSPTTSSGILATLSRGQSFTVTGNLQNGWYPVTLSNGIKGYIHGPLVTFQK